MRHLAFKWARLTVVNRSSIFMVDELRDGVREETMIRTITLGAHISVQGAYVRSLPDGKIVVRDGERVFTGRPVNAPPQAA